VTDVAWTVVVGGGGGSRFGALKQYAALGGARVIDLAVAAARSASDGVVVVVPPVDAGREGAIAGGATRSESVRRGLATVPPEVTIVCVHDAVRPLATPALFTAVIDAVRGGADAAVPAVPVTDTIKVVGPDRAVASTPDRSTLVAVQTPQAFRAEALRAAYAGDLAGATDCASLVERRGGRVRVVEGSRALVKVTTPHDLDVVARLLG
jgi:2-C-methyl-D-erythritol 4-phosphate cytidylyltransferase